MNDSSKKVRLFQIFKLKKDDNKSTITDNVKISSDNVRINDINVDDEQKQKQQQQPSPSSENIPSSTFIDCTNLAAASSKFDCMNNVNKCLKSVNCKKKTNCVKDLDPDKLAKELIKPGPPLPMVKFDSDGDFFKEPLEINEDEFKIKIIGQGEVINEKSHMIRLTKTISIDSKKVKKAFKNGFKFAFSQIGLSGLVVGYVILGALLFMKIESEYELENQIKIEKNREEFFNSVRSTAEDMFNEFLKHNFHTKYNQFRNEEMRLKDNELIKKPSWRIELEKEEFNKLLKNHLTVLLMENEKIEDKEKPTMLVREDVWNYPNALLYSTTVITTIGYGNITPKSNLGKILTIFYAMIGIPLMFMFLTNTGDLLAELFISLYSKCIRYFYRKLFKHKLKMPYSATKFQENKQEMLTEFEMEYDNPNDRHVPIVATLGVVTIYIFAGSLLFSFTENWSILDGAYFCFITFTTIGFGDFVPGRNTLASGKNGVTALCAIYLLLGMVIMTMCFKLMQDEVVSKARWFGKRLGIIDQ